MPSLRTEIKLLLILAFWSIFSVGYFNRFPLPGMIGKAYLMTLAGIVASAAWGYGSSVMIRLELDGLTEAEYHVISTLLGFGLLSLFMIGSGFVGLWTKGGAVILVGIGLVSAWRQIKTIQREQRWNLWRLDSLDKGPFLLISLGALLSLAIAFTPPTYYDSLVYHLALPQAYVQARHWVGQPELIYSAFPQTMEMLWTLGLLLANDVVANLLGWMIAVLGVLAVYLFAKRYFGTGTASWAAAFLSIMPAYVLLSSGGYIDVGLTVFSFLSFYVLCLWAGTGLFSEKPHSLQWLSLAGCFAGWAVGTKYTGAIPLLIGILFIFIKAKDRKPGRGLYYAAIYAGAALLIFSPWLIKNIYYVGNPVFPFLYTFSFKQLNPWLGQAAAGYFVRGLTEYTPRTGFQLFKLLWDIGVNGLNFGGGMDVLGDLGWAPLFVFLPTAWLLKKRSTSLPLILLYAGVFYLAWGMIRPVLRFLLPLAPFLAIAAGYGYDQGIGQQSKGIRLVANIFLAALLASNMMLFLDVADALSLFKVPLGYESRAEYLSKKLNYFPAAAFLDQLPKDSLTYVVGDQRGYYYNRPVLVTPVFNNNPLTEWANEASSPEDLAARLKARHITHLLINHTEMARLDGAYHIFPFTAVGTANWEGVRSHLRLLYRDRHCEVLAL